MITFASCIHHIPVLQFKLGSFGSNLGKYEVSLAIRIGTLAILPPSPSTPSVTRQALAQCGSASGWPVVCGLLTARSKDFITQVQMFLRRCLLRLGTVKQRKDRVEEVTRENLGRAVWAH